MFHVTAMPYPVDGLQNVLGEATAATSLLLLAPFLIFGIVELIAPQPLHEFLLRNAKLVGVHLGELLEGEGPAVETRAEANGTLVWGHL